MKPLLLLLALLLAGCSSDPLYLDKAPPGFKGTEVLSLTGTAPGKAVEVEKKLVAGNVNMVFLWAPW